jgi:hypothetical protein
MRNPVESTEDVLNVFPFDIKDSTTAPIRDAFVEAATQVFQQYQISAKYAAYQSDPLTANGIYLKAIAREHEVYASGEDLEIRAKLFDTPETVTPVAILAIVNSIVSPHTMKQAQLFESELDRWFCCSTSEVYIGSGPHYQDRLYPDDIVENGGYARGQSDPGTAWVFSNDVGRYFVLRVPTLTAADSEFAFVSNAADDSLWTTNGTDSGDIDTYLFTNVNTEADLYSEIISAVDRIVGQGIRWQLYVDPRL